MAELITNAIFSLVLVAVFLILLYKWSFTTSSSTKNSPPSPPKLPIIGNLHQLGSPWTPPHRSLQALSQIHGPLMLLRLGNIPVLVVSSAEAAREIMKTHDLAFASRPKSTVLEKLAYNYKDVATAPYGEYWRQMKSICVLNLLSNKRVRSFHGVREEETRSMINKIKEISQRGGVVNVRKMLMTLTNDVVSITALGRKYYDDEDLKELLVEFTELAGSLHVGDYIPWLGWLSRLGGLDAKLESFVKRYDEFIDTVVQEHIDKSPNTSNRNDHGLQDQNKDRKDFVDVLLEIQRESLLHPPLDRVSIKALILDMFLAGTDTTSTLLEWAMAEILKHPRVMIKLQKEVRGVKKGEEEILTEDDLVDMHYLKAVIKETLRLHPPLTLLVPKMSTQDVKINGYDIKANTQVLVNAWQIGRDPKSFNYKPEEFEPERFLEVNSGLSYKGTDFQLIPFGAGRRVCPGIQFATSVNEIALANLLHKFDWTLPGGVRNDELDMMESSGLTIHKKYPLKAVAIPYSST
ncbi:putative cytochrome P450 [Rosa chinensis]|uniref:Putative cytochrome P450 n=1 Tax=Rosa chinensis TaxID=74649 RepID=A0A2P6QYA5_ROSCH|nr:cytochrome P450 736A117 [Rosa chinensis]PRQ39178.1 putative cytochrome P450 [Rosa chinensis]